MRERIIQILIDVLGVARPVASSDDFGPRTCAEWDSARHLRVVMALEEEFSCVFEPAEIPLLTSVPAIERILKDRTDERL